MTTTYLTPMLTRAENGHRDFVETLVRCGGITEIEAVRVKAFYLTKKLAKMDYGIGRISVKHGAYLDRSAILRALELTA